MLIFLSARVRVRDRFPGQLRDGWRSRPSRGLFFPQRQLPRGYIRGGGMRLQFDDERVLCRKRNPRVRTIPVWSAHKESKLFPGGGKRPEPRES